MHTNQRTILSTPFLKQRPSCFCHIEYTRPASQPMHLCVILLPNLIMRWLCLQLYNTALDFLYIPKMKVTSWRSRDETFHLLSHLTSLCSLSAYSIKKCFFVNFMQSVGSYLLLPNTFLIHPTSLPTQAGVLSFLVIQDQFSSAKIVLGSWSVTKVWLTYLEAALLEETLPRSPST